jgi:hypothetical protein
MTHAHLYFSLEPMTCVVGPVLYIERWKYIDGYDGIYKVSTFGRVKAMRRKIKLRSGFRLHEERIMKLSVNRRGYLYLKLPITAKKNGVRYKTYTVHRLVAVAFLKNINNKPEINHKWGDKKDNRITEIEWSTHSENVVHSYATGLKAGKKGESSHYAKFTENDVLEIRRLRQRGVSRGLVAEKFNTSPNYISSICGRASWKHI